MRRRAAISPSGANRTMGIFWCACRWGSSTGHILLPKGFIQGQQLQEKLRQLTLPFGSNTNFDQLPTPFRAVATDLETGQAVLLEKGDLSIAMRASISAPGVFAPVDYEGRLLVDGGLAENLPIDVARAMHADMLIVSDVSFPLQSREQLDSALSISNQMLAILVRKDSDRQKASLGPNDILIEPALGTSAGHGLHDRRRYHLARRGGGARGGTAARRAARERRRLSRRTWRGVRLASRALPVIRFVRVDQESKRYEKTILAEMQPLVGKPLDRGRGRRAHHRTVRPRLFRDLGLHRGRPRRGSGARSPGLEVHARRKSWGPNYVRFGLNLQDDFQGNTQYNAAARFLMTEIDALGAELLTDVQIGSDPKITSEFYQPLDALRTWFVAPSLRIEARDLPIYANNLQIADFRDREAEADVDFGRNLGNWGEIRVGLHRINGLEYDRWGNPDLVDPQYNNGEYFFKFSYDQLDNVRFPREGQTFSLQWDANRTNLGADIAFDRVTADWLFATSRGPQHAAAVDLGGLNRGRQTQSDGRAGFLFVGRLLQPIGARAPIAARTRLRDRARDLLSQNQPRRRGLLRISRLCRRCRFEIGNTWHQLSDISVGSAHKDASAFVAFDTFLGPRVRTSELRLRHSNRATPGNPTSFWAGAFGHLAAQDALREPSPRPDFAESLLRGRLSRAAKGATPTEPAALGELLHLFEHQCRLIADARIFVLARHVLQHAIALRRGEEPMGLLPVRAEQLCERIAAPQAHADAVGPRQHRDGAHHVLNACDSHDAGTIAESPGSRQLMGGGFAC